MNLLKLGNKLYGSDIMKKEIENIYFLNGFTILNKTIVRLPLKNILRLFRFKTDFNNIYKTLVEAQEAIYKKYGSSEDGISYKILKKNLKIANAELEKLYYGKSEIDNQEINISEFDNFEICELDYEFLNVFFNESKKSKQKSK